MIGMDVKLDYINANSGVISYAKEVLGGQTNSYVWRNYLSIRENSCDASIMILNSLILMKIVKKLFELQYFAYSLWTVREWVTAILQYGVCVSVM